MSGFKDVGGEYKHWGFKYAVGPDGEVLNKFTNQILTPTKKPNGYMSTHFIHKGKRTWPTVHRVVLNTFRGAPKSSNLQGNHLDGDKTNNSLSNLEWCTPKENARHMDQVLGRRSRGENHPSSKYSNELIRAVRDMKKDFTYKELSVIFGIPQSYITKICCMTIRSRDENP